MKKLIIAAGVLSLVSCGTVGASVVKDPVVYHGNVRSNVTFSDSSRPEMGLKSGVAYITVKSMPLDVTVDGLTIESGVLQGSSPVLQGSLNQ